MLLLNSFYILGLRMLVDYDVNKSRTKIENKMLLWFLRYHAEKHLPSWIYKPLLSCVSCMGGVHGIYFYYLSGGFNEYNLWIAFVYLISLVGLNTFIWQNIKWD